MNTGRMFVVDDEESIRLTLRDYFTRYGYDVVTATDGEDALTKFIPGWFDCIISDLKMPKLDGIGLLKKIRSQDKTVMFLMITGSPTEVCAAEATQEGACGYLSKPFRMEVMRLKVEKMLQARKAKKSLREEK
jgi:DNA-binding NtrC family response regulator